MHDAFSTYTQITSLITIMMLTVAVIVIQDCPHSMCDALRPVLCEHCKVGFKNIHILVMYNSYWSRSLCGIFIARQPYVYKGCAGHIHCSPTLCIQKLCRAYSLLANCVKDAIFLCRAMNARKSCALGGVQVYKWSQILCIGGREYRISFDTIWVIEWENCLM